MDSEFLSKLVCPVTKMPLRLENADVVRLEDAREDGREVVGWLVADPPEGAPDWLVGFAYPVVAGGPIPLLIEDERIGLARTKDIDP